MADLMLLDLLREKLLPFSPLITQFDAASVAAYDVVTGAETQNLTDRGIHLRGDTKCTFILLAGCHYGNVLINNKGDHNIVLLGRAAPYRLIMNLMIYGSDCLVVLPDVSKQETNINHVVLRSDRQVFFFGAGATSVGCNVEIHGPGRVVAIGDDCMLSSGIWLRNYDMHVMFDLETLQQINRSPGDILVERHVWIGQDVLMVGGLRVGFGSIIGARTLVRSDFEPHSAIAGIPARTIRTGVGWSRSADSILRSDVDLYRPTE